MQLTDAEEFAFAQIRLDMRMPALAGFSAMYDWGIGALEGAMVGILETQTPSADVRRAYFAGVYADLAIEGWVN